MQVVNCHCQPFAVALTTWLDPSTARPAAASPHVDELVHTLKVRLKDLAVVQLFLALGGINQVVRFGPAELFVSNPGLTERLQIFDPSQSNTFALHRLCSPENWVGYFAIEKHAKSVFLWFIFAFDPLQLWVNLCEEATEKVLNIGTFTK